MTAPCEDQPRIVNIRMPAELYEAVQQTARDHERSIAATIRVAIRFYLAKALES